MVHVTEAKPADWKEVSERLVRDKAFDDALEYLEACKRSSPRVLAIRVEIADLLHKMQRPLDARIVAEEADEVVDLTVAEARVLIKLHLRLGADHRACAIAQRMLNKGQTLFDLIWVSVDFFIKDRELIRARNELVKAEKVEGIQASELIVISRYYRKIHQAIKFLHPSVKRKFLPTVDDRETALALAEKAALLDSASVLAKLVIAEAAVELTRFELMLKMLAPFATQEDTASVDERLRAAEILEQNSQKTLAIKVARRVVNEPGWSVADQVRYSHILNNQGFGREVEPLLEKINVASVRSKITLYKMREIYFALSRYDRTVVVCDRILELYPYDKESTKIKSMIDIMGLGKS